MTDHSAFDHDVDVVLESCMEWDRVTSLLISMMSMDKSLNPRFSFRLHKLEDRFQECREDIESSIFTMMEHHLLACDDYLPWIASEGRKAEKTEEWLEKRFGGKFVSLKTELRLDDKKAMSEAIKQKSVANAKIHDLEAEVKRLEAELEEQKAKTADAENRYEHALNALADPDIH